MIRFILSGDLVKTVGVIGGVGPETTAEFYLRLISGCYKKNKESRPPILIWNVPLNYKMEENVILNSTGEEKYLPYLLEAAKRLENAGADFLVMPCNTLHIFINQIRASVKIPVLSITEETIAFLTNLRIKRVGVLATQSTLKSNLYANALKGAGITQVVLDKQYQNKLGPIIENLVLGTYTESDKRNLIDLISKFSEKGVQDVILACTDLQLLTPHLSGLTTYDTMEILAESTVREILK